MRSRREAIEGVDWAAVRERMLKALSANEQALTLSPERARQTMDERARALAQPPPEQRPLGETIEVITFELAHEHYALDTRYVREVSRLRSFTPLPRTPDFVLGLGSLRGELLPLFDLRKFFGLDPKGVTDLSRIIVIGEDRAEFGVLADEVTAVTPLPIRAITGLAASGLGVGRSYVRGVTEDALIVLDGAALLNEQAFFLE